MSLPDITPVLPRQITSPQATRLRTFLQHLDASLSTGLSIYVYGSAAVALYLADDSPKYEYGYTRDIDIGAMEPNRVEDLVLDSDIVDPPLHLQTYDFTRWMIHPDWQESTVDVSHILETKRLAVRLLHPIDLIITKLERAGDQDLEDGQLLCDRYIDDVELISRRTREAAKFYPLNARIVSQVEYSFAAIFEEEIGLRDLL